MEGSQLSEAAKEPSGGESAEGSDLDASYELVQPPVYELRVCPVQNTASAQHAWLQMLKVVSQCADPKLPQVACLRAAMGRCSRMLQMWTFPRLPFAINALLIQSTAGKEDQTVTMKRLWDQQCFQQNFPAPAFLPLDIDALHAMFMTSQLGAISPSQLINLYSQHYGLQDTLRFVVACLTEIPTCLAVALSQGPDQFPQIMSLLNEHPEQARIRGSNGRLALHRALAYVKGPDEQAEGKTTESTAGPIRAVFPSEQRSLLCKRLLEIYPESSRLFTNVSSFLCGDDGYAAIHLECRFGPNASGDVIRQLSSTWLGYFAPNTPSLAVQMCCQETTPSFWTWLWKELTALYCVEAATPSTAEAAEAETETETDGPQVLGRLVQLGCLSADAADALAESFEAFQMLPPTDPRAATPIISATSGNAVMESYLRFPDLDNFAASLRPEVRADPQAVQFFELDDHTQAILLAFAKLFRVYWRPHHITHRVDITFPAEAVTPTDVDFPLIQLLDYRKVAGNKGEAVLEALLEAAEVPKCTYQTEAEQQNHHHQPQQPLPEGELVEGATAPPPTGTPFRTPDFLFADPIRIHGVEHPVSWMDAKSGWVVPFLTPLNHLARLVEQMLAYKELFCAQRPGGDTQKTCGLVFWRYGAVPQLLSIIPKGVYIATSDYCFEFGELNFAGRPDAPDNPRELSELCSFGATEGTWDISYADVLRGQPYARELKGAAVRELRSLINKRLYERFPRGTSFAPYPFPNSLS